MEKPVTVDRPTTRRMIELAEEALDGSVGNYGLLDQVAALRWLKDNLAAFGGDPEHVADVVSSHGYPSHLAKRQTTNDLLLVFEWPLADAEKQRAIDTLTRFSQQQQPRFRDVRHCRLSTSAHPADVLLALREAGLKARFAEDTEDPYRVQELQARDHIRLSIRRAVLAAGVGFGLMLAMHLGVLPAIDSGSSLTDLRGRGFWLVIALLCLFTMVYSGHSYYNGAWKQMRHGQANMDTLVAVGTAAAGCATGPLESR